jgi:uncharacterized membrane protein YvbJ
MVFCVKCGTKNVETNTHCTNCGAVLVNVEGSSDAQKRSRHDYNRPRREAITGLVIGLLIIILGIAFLIGAIFNLDVPWVSLVMIYVGVFLVIRWIKKNHLR